MVRSAERLWIRDLFADTLSYLTGTAHTLPLATCLGWLPQNTRRLQDRDPLLAADQDLLPISLSPRGKGSSHNLSMSYKNLLAQTHLFQSTAAKVLCTLLQKASQLLSCPPLHPKLSASSGKPH